MLNIPISEYFQTVNPKYIYLKITPLKSIRNYNSDKIINAIASLYKKLGNKIKKDNNKYFFTRNIKLSYYIYLEKDNIEFYFIIPDEYKNLLITKIKDVWTGVTIKQVNLIPSISPNCLKYSLDYNKKDVFSLTTDKRSNILLASLCQTLYLLEDGDKIGVFYNFIPTNNINWRSEYDRIIQSIKNGKSQYKTGNKAKIMACLNVLEKTLNFVLDIALSLFGESKLRDNVNNNNKLELSNNTKSKRDKCIVKTQVLVLSESQSLKRAENNLLSICESYKTISEDNELVSQRIETKNVNFLDSHLKGVPIFKSSSSECQNFIALPAKELIEEFKLECVNTIETEVPKALRNGYISLGINTCKGFKQEAFLRDTYNQGNLPLVLIGEQGSGKSTYISNYINDIQSRGEGAVVIDYIKDCELTKTLEKYVNNDKKIVLDLTDIDNCQGFGYNELKPKSDSAIDIIDVANRKSLYIQMLIDSLNIDGEPLSSLMDRYLNAACNIVFLNNNASLKDVVKCLNDCNYRSKLLENIRDDIKVMLEDEIGTLQELDEVNKEGIIVGTKGHKIDGINHRINLLKKDLRLKLMFQKNCEGNIDLVKAMNEGKIVFIKMPQAYFSTPYSKNVIVTYFITKIWSAMLVRGSMFEQPNRFHVVIDEVFQAPTAMKLLKTQEILPQMRKFGCKFVVSCQYTKQMKVIDQTLRSAGASYMFLKGSGRNNFSEFKDELYPYTLEDLENLEQFESLNLINYEDGKAVFITKLPKPLR